MHEAEPLPLPLPLPLPPPQARLDDNERTRQFQVVLRKAIRRKTAPEPERVSEEDPEGDAIGRRIGLAFGPYQSDPLMMRIAEYAERFLVERQRRNAVEGG